MNIEQRSETLGRKAGRVMLIVVSILLGLILVLLGGLVALSPGRMQPLVDETGRPQAGSLSEKVFVSINGVRQRMLIQSRDISRPVLLYLHGGMPEYFLQQKYPTGLEEIFTVVWWEQRGSGLSYSPDIPTDSMTVEQMVSDTIAVTNYLRQRFGKERIYLMSHSGGTFIGIQAAARAPELFHAYIGVAQMSSQLMSEKLAYDYMLQRFRAEGNTAMVRRLEASPVTLDDGTPAAYLALRDPGMHPLGIGTTHDMKSHITGVFLASLTCPEYTPMEKFRMWQGKARSGVSPFWETMTTTGLSRHVPRVDIPVYFLHGIHDYTVSYTEAKSYFERLEAPVKGFYTFQNSAHSPIFEEPEKARSILREDVLQGITTLADAR
jgi:pimeloyl-ACP methyl ester carboxylesterase